MQIELLEIRDHLNRYPPFDALPEDSLDAIARQVEVAYFKAGTDILLYGADIHDLHYVRSGAVEIYRRNGELYNRLSEGDIFGQAGLLRSNKVRFPARAIEDSLIYFIPAALFAQLCEQHDSFADFVEAEGQSRLKSAVESQGKASDLMQIKVRTLISRQPVCASQDTPVQQAAQLMTEQSVSSLVLLDGDAPGAAMVGILTDRDLRTRVLAVGLDAATPVSQVMSPDPITIQADDSVFEAMLSMLRHNIHYLPVVQRRRPVGMINLSDIIRYESQSSLYLVNSIFNQPDVAGLQGLLPDLRGTFVRMANENATAHMIGSAMAGIGRAFSQRLLELAEQKLGPPPVPYCFLAAGSMARDEQLVVTDQDNALILDDRFDPDLHDGYFAELAKFVSDGLAACGYSYCKGGIMATNRQWRQPLKVWRGYFSQWIDRPNPQTLLNSCIFFDLDGVHGEVELAENLKELLAEKASNAPAFLAALARNALNRTPPLGFFRTFVMETDGQQKHIINLKGRGTAPLTDLIRVHALACGSKAQNSLERLDAIAKTKLLQPEAISQLRYALEFLSLVRIRHQANALAEGREPNNYIEPEKVSASDRHNLKEAFQILSNAQKFLRFRYPAQPGKSL
ncbi:MAG: CBS domain-containing protein [Gammaproteobacteria bacterium]|nr:CBS domain-containing protein [Gammaproteobacteria bacterium]MBU0883473.1 CBS domain-containing protein [Gammaproteobacteria bacterium]MBU1859696.1 CBS domain-containing protein [Gammaproteobacteria bacterium]